MKKLFGKLFLLRYTVYSTWFRCLMAKFVFQNDEKPTKKTVFRLKLFLLLKVCVLIRSDLTILNSFEVGISNIKCT